jgi:hypothetical protein
MEREHPVNDNKPEAIWVEPPRLDELFEAMDVEYAAELRGPDEPVGWRHYACDAGVILGGLVYLAGLIYCLAGEWGWGFTLVVAGHCAVLAAASLRRVP